MSSLEFANASVLPYVFLGVLVTVAAGLWWMWRRTGIVRFFGRKGGRIYGSARILCFLLALALTGLGLGLLLAEPYLERHETYPVYEPLAIAVVTDISKSMLAQATENPCGSSRLDVLESEVGKFVGYLNRRKATGLAADKLALVLFARFGYRAIPVPTDDYALFLGLFTQEMLPANVLTMMEGTNHWHAVERALEVFRLHRVSGKRVMLVLTDGEPDGPEEILVENRDKALRDLSELGAVSVYVIGVGDPDARYFIPLKRLPNGCPDMEVGYLVQREGPDADELIDTRTDVVKLRELARELGGSYVHSGEMTDLASLLRGIVETERETIGTIVRTERVDLTEYLIIATLVFLGLFLLLKTP